MIKDDVHHLEGDACAFGSDGQIREQTPRKRVVRLGLAQVARK